VHGGDELFWSCAFEQEPGGAGMQGAEDVVVLLEGGEDEDLRAGGSPGEFTGGGDAVEVGHADVHQHDIGREPTRSFDGLASGRCLPDDLDGGVGGEEFDETGAHQVVVVGDQDAGHVCWPR
jgi:hypothetical protein